MDNKRNIELPNELEIQNWKSQEQIAIKEATDGLFTLLIEPQLKPTPLKPLAQAQKEQREILEKAITSYSQMVEQAFTLLSKEATPEERPTLNTIGLRWLEQARTTTESLAGSFFLSKEEATIAHTIAARVQKQGLLPHAIMIYRLISQLCPTYFVNWVSLGHALRDNGDLHQAEEIFDIACLMFPGTPRIGLFAGSFYLSHGQRTKAKGALEAVRNRLQELGEAKGEVYQETLRLLALC